MSSRNIIKADLLRILPGFNESRLPPDLIALSETFITQAQHLFMNQSELPAKNFVCAHIACEQLSTKLSLPELNIKSAPIPPAKYKALFKRIRSEATFKQVRDSGHSTIDTRRRIARDHAKEICSKIGTIQVAVILQILDHLIPTYGPSDMRALVAAVYLIALQSKLHAKTTPNTIMRALMHDLGLSKQEIENEMDYVHRKSRGTNWFEVSTLKKLRLIDGPSKKRARITQTRMMANSINFGSETYQANFQSWKKEMLATLQTKLSESQES